MTADERIEKLLNRFGQTISDLPKSADNDWSMAVYGSEHLINAKKEALSFIIDEWRDTDEVPEIRYEVEEVLLGYICHLADVIDRMEAALETAALIGPCFDCTHIDEHNFPECEKPTPCFSIHDKCLHDMIKD